MHPTGQAPSDWGPGRLIPYRRKGDIEFGPSPAYNPGSVEMEKTQEEQADRLVGLDQDGPLSQIRQQFLVDKFLSHTAEVIGMCYRCFQRFGPDSIFFRVTGVPDPQVFNKGNPDENFDVTISYDVLNNDPEKQENKLNSMISLLQLDKNGRINVDDLVTLIAGSIDPVLADSVLQPVEEAQQQILKDVTDDISKIYAGIEMPARPNGAEIAMQILQSYVQQPDIAARLQSDQAFAQRLQKYMGQYQFAMQQVQNAQIGRIGTAPAEMGGVQTQQMQQ